MELFCLGPGNYTEKDIKEIARCFTGWEVRGGAFRFNAHQHDDGAKSFLGKRGKYAGEEAVDIVLEQPAAAKFLAKKLVRFFVIDDQEIDDEFVAPLANQLRQSDFDIGRTIRMILSSNFFFSDSTIGKKVRSPVEMSIGLLRTMEASTNMGEIANRIRDLGHLPLFPPNVKGWEGGRQWINASTYFGRANLVRDLVAGGDTTFERGELAAIITKGDRGNAEKWVQQLCDSLLAVPLPAESFQTLLELADDRRLDLNRRVANVIVALGATPEFQLN